MATRPKEGEARAAAAEPAGYWGPVPTWFHLLVVAWICGMLLFANRAPERYESAMQEDHTVEWSTVFAFLIAGVIRLRTAVRRRSVFDFLVGLFCIFVAGEEFSWGQRLIGFTPPDAFLENNTQQEVNVHNFARTFGQPKYTLMLALAGYGLLLPALELAPAGRDLLRRLRVTAPPRSLAPWFAGTIAMLYWYPVTFTGEWCELLSGALFVAALPLGSVRLAASLTASGLLGLVFTAISSMQRAADPAQLACAKAETQALLDYVVANKRDARLGTAGLVHERVWTLVRDGDVDSLALGALANARCAGESREALRHRHRFAIDPWGTAYWLHATEVIAGERTITVYSFGPNRRRDDDPDLESDNYEKSDDVAEVKAAFVR